MPVTEVYPSAIGSHLGFSSSWSEHDDMDDKNHDEQ